MKAIFLILLVFFSLCFEVQANTTDSLYCPPGSVGKVGGHYNPPNYKCYEGAVVLKEQEYCSPGSVRKDGGFYSPKIYKCYEGAIIPLEEEYCSPGSLRLVGSFYKPKIYKCYEGVVVPKVEDYCSPGSIVNYGRFYNTRYQKCYEGVVAPIDWQYCRAGNKGLGRFYPPNSIPKDATCTSTETTLQAKGVTEMTGDVAVFRNGEKVRLNQGSKILEGDKISTGTTGQLSFKFDDGTNVSVGHNTDLVVDAAKFKSNCNVSEDPGNCSYGLNLVKGSMRWVTGLIGKFNKRNVHIETATAYIGIRGTDFEMAHIIDGNNSVVPLGLYIAVYDGTVYASNKVGSLDATVKQYIYVKNQDTPPILINSPPDIFGK